MSKEETARPRVIATPETGRTRSGAASNRGDERRSTFARDLTRAIFGRHYWNDALEAERRRALVKKRPPG
jgi:hypothetical protein